LDVWLFRHFLHGRSQVSRGGFRQHAFGSGGEGYCGFVVSFLEALDRAMKLPHRGQPDVGVNGHGAK
jgi:hypothetical protein